LLCPRRNAVARSTRGIHPAPASGQRSAASTGSPKRFSEPATPWTSWTAGPPATSTAGGSSRWCGAPRTLSRAAPPNGRRLAADDGGELNHRGGPRAVEDHSALGPDRSHLHTGHRAPDLDQVERPRPEHRPESVGVVIICEVHPEHGGSAECLQPSLHLTLGVEPEPVARRVLGLLRQPVLDGVHRDPPPAGP